MRSFLFLAAIFLCLPSAFGIGRSGNGTISSKWNGFELDGPEKFEELAPLGEEKLRLSSHLLEPSNVGIRNLFIEIAGAKEGLPELAALSREALPARMEKLGWQTVNHGDPCVLAFRKSTDTTETVAMFWGGKKGLVAAGPKSGNVTQALEALQKSVRLTKGACAW